MASVPPLHGLRVIECSALGPAQITTFLADLGAEVIKVEPPGGDYIREMTWPIVDGVSLMHLHLNRGKQSLVLDLRTELNLHALDADDRVNTSHEPDVWQACHRLADAARGPRDDADFVFDEHDSTSL